MRILLPLLLIASQSVFAQTADSLVRLARSGRGAMFREEVFWSDVNSGFYIGPVGSYELSRFALGGEVKLYAAYYHQALSNSVYANVRHLYAAQPGMPDMAIGAGVHLTIFGLEGTVYLGDDRPLWYVTPKIGMDWGNLSIFYGYGLSVGPNDLPSRYGHTLSLKYSLYLGTLGL